METQEDMEKFAKRWEVGALAKDIETVVAVVKDVSTKQDRILDNMVTRERFNEGMQSAKGYTDDEIKKVHLEYRPLANNAKWITRTLVVAIIGNLIAIGLQVL